MTTRTLTKIGSTVTLRPVLPYNSHTDEFNTYPLDTTFQLSDSYMFPEVNDQVGQYANSTMEISPVATDRGYAYFGPDLQLKGLYWTLGTVNESAVVARFRKRFVNLDARTVAVITPEPSVSPPFNRYEISLIGDVDFTVATRVTVPSATFIVNLATQVEGWAGVGLVYPYMFGGSSTNRVSLLSAGFMNFLYTSSEAEFSMLCGSISITGEVTSHAAFPLSQAGYWFGEFHDPYTTIAQNLNNRAYWTYVENYSFPSPGVRSAITPRLINWQRSQWGNAASGWQSYQEIAFSDPADQAFYDAHIAFNSASPAKVVSNANSVVMVFAISGGPKRVFVVSPDWDTYESFIIEGSTFASPSGSNPFYIARYYRDPDGNHYGIDETAQYMYRLYPDGVPGPDAPSPAPEPEPEASAGSPVVRSWGFTLDGHDFYVNRLGAQMTLLYDANTQRWSRWATLDQSKWRAHQGFNWLGMSQDNYFAGAASNIVAGDDTEGILWTLDPNSGEDDSVADPPVRQSFARRVIGGVPMRTRQGARNSLVQATVDVGDPTTTGFGTSFYLDISDDYGKTWQDCGAQEIPAGSFGTEVMWRSMGVIRQPGRLFRFTDYGATARIDGVDVLVEPGNGR
jgi:hypothetical protein